MIKSERGWRRGEGEGGGGGRAGNLCVEAINTKSDVLGKKKKKKIMHSV